MGEAERFTGEEACTDGFREVQGYEAAKTGMGHLFETCVRQFLIQELANTRRKEQLCGMIFRTALIRNPLGTL